ncbi:MAG: hypothetical protein JW874_02480 [Spirochaetales bacterium]|nr:hypothetical protein [Spirochaetales bacterium]
MAGKKIAGFLKNSMKGYRNFVYGSGMVLFFIIASALAGILLVFPLWLTATKTPVLFTLLFLSIIAVYGLTVLLRSLLSKSSRAVFISRIKPALLFAARVLIPVILLYPAVLCISMGIWPASLPFFIAVFFLIGNILYGKKNGPRS